LAQRCFQALINPTRSNTTTATPTPWLMGSGNNSKKNMSAAPKTQSTTSDRSAPVLLNSHAKKSQQAARKTAASNEGSSFMSAPFARYFHRHLGLLSRACRSTSGSGRGDAGTEGRLPFLFRHRLTSKTTREPTATITPAPIVWATGLRLAAQAASGQAIAIINAAPSASHHSPLCNWPPIASALLPQSQLVQFQLQPFAFIRDELSPFWVRILGRYLLCKCFDGGVRSTLKYTSDGITTR
jgi:hypothetical protein